MQLILKLQISINYLYKHYRQSQHGYDYQKLSQIQ